MKKEKSYHLLLHLNVRNKTLHSRTHAPTKYSNNITYALHRDPRIMPK